MIRELQHMPTRCRVWLNGAGLQDIDPCIHVHDINYGAPGVTTQTVEHARHHGARVTRQRMGSSMVSVVFQVREYDITTRQEILNRIAAWAMTGGVLTTDDRPGQRLHVVCTTPPSVQSSLRWTAQQTLVFTAFDNPFWEDVTPKFRTLTGTHDEGILYGAGAAADPFVTARVEATQDITALTLTVGGTHFTFSGISVEAVEALVIAYDETHTLKVYNEDTNVSYLSKRTADSHDDLMLLRGQFGNVSFSSDGSATVTFEVRGLYL